MTRTELLTMIRDTFSVAPDYPWATDPDYAVFRHLSNKKWFALLMRIPRSKLIPSASGDMEILNIKLDPILIDALRTRPGFYPAWHMNKNSWISIGIEDGIGDEELCSLITMSYDLTGVIKKR